MSEDERQIRLINEEKFWKPDSDMALTPEVSKIKIHVDKPTEELLRSWGVEVTLNGLVIGNPYRIFEENSQPREINFPESSVVSINLFQLDKNTVGLDIHFKDGRIGHDKLILDENGQVEHEWCKNIEHPKNK